MSLIWSSVVQRLNLSVVPVKIMNCVQEDFEELKAVSDPIGGSGSLTGAL